MNKEIVKKQIKPIQVPPELRQLIVKLNKLKEVLMTCQSTLKMLGDYYLSLEAEVYKLVKLSQKIEKEVEVKRKQ